MAAGPFVLENLASLATARGDAPRRGGDLDTAIQEITDPAVAVEAGRVAWVGPRAELPESYAGWPRQDGGGGCLVPGFVDPHTHLVFAGDRAAEFDLRARGAEYLEILEAGGGILNSAARTRDTPEDELYRQSTARVRRILAAGTTTVEIKSGYGLDTETECKMLRVARKLGEDHPLRVRTTFLGAHAVPADYKGRADAYVDLVVEEMLPAACAEGLADYADVFCEDGVFDVPQSRRVLEAAREAGLGLRMHADEVHPMGGGALAAELGCKSADHLIATDEACIQALAGSETVATILPGTAFVLGKGKWAPARRMLEAGCALALATDLNPGSCHLESVPMAMQIAVVQMGLTPAEALTAATLNAAATLDLADEVGTIEPGKAADLVLLDAPDYRHLTYRLGANLVRKVWVGGAAVHEARGA